MTAVNKRFAVDPQDITSCSSTQLYGMGEKVEFVGNSDGTVSAFMYVKAGGTLTQYAPYEIYHDGTTVTTMAPSTGAAVIGVPQIAVTSAYYAWLQIKGNATCAHTNEVVAVGDNLEVLTTAAVSNVDGSTGSTVRTSKSFAVAKAAVTTSTTSNIAVYLYGDGVTDIAGS